MRRFDHFRMQILTETRFAPLITQPAFRWQHFNFVIFRLNRYQNQIKRKPTRRCSVVCADPKMSIFRSKCSRRGAHIKQNRCILSFNHTTLLPHRFYFPHGKPLPTIAIETQLQRLKSAFDEFPNNCVSKENFEKVFKVCGLPRYWRMPAFHCTPHTPTGLVDGKRFIDFWKQ